MLWLTWLFLSFTLLGLSPASVSSSCPHGPVSVVVVV
jgi:hypothetical protein